MVKGEQPPKEVPITFHFDSGSKRELVVRGSGVPIPGATVDVEWIEHLDSDHRWLAGTYLTDSDGRVRLTGGGDQLVEVFVYADGFEPLRAIWHPGTPLALDLTPRNSKMSFKSSPFVLARIRDVLSPQAAQTVRLSAAGDSSLKLKAGTYDVTAYGNRPDTFFYQRVSIKGGETRTLDPTTDQRPHWWNGTHRRKRYSP